MENLKKCDYLDCGHEEFLVWPCEKCLKKFCEMHRFDHDCYSASTTSATCSVGSSREREVATDSQVPVQELFNAVESRHVSLDNNISATIHPNVKSSAMPTDTKMKATLDKIENVEKVISGSKSDKQKNIAKKTKAMLLRGKSIGNDDIPPEDRIYISCFFSSNSTTKCFFFSKHATVGNSLQYIGDSQTLLAYGTPTRPAGMTLCFTTLGDDCSPCGWNYSSLLSTYIDEDFYELGIAVIDIKDHIDAQNMIIAEQQNQVKSGEKEDYKVVACQPYKKGEKVIYKNTEVGVIIGVHSEDDPPYYTIQLSGEGGSLKEKQTVGDNLSIFTEPVGSQETLPTAQSAGECFAIRLSSGGKVKRIENIPVDGTVGDLKRVISKYTGVLPARQKLLYKGKVLKIDSAKLRTDGVAERKKDVVLEDNSLVILMTMTK